MISSKMGTSFFDTVPEMSEFDFDLGTMDTFEDFDINMTGMDIMTDNGADPFGDFSLEKSFDLIELNKSFQQSSQNSGYSNDSSEALLEDFDGEETLKQDIMWSAHSTQSQQIRSSSSRCKSPPSAVSKMSLTPPSSYISQMFQDSPLSSSSSEDDRDTGCEPPPPAPTPPHVTTDHCYTNTQLLTPPESSEDEDSFISTSIGRQITIKIPCGVHEKILQMERQRRPDLNHAYTTLKDFVPTIAHSDTRQGHRALHQPEEQGGANPGDEADPREEEPGAQEETPVARVPDDGDPGGQCALGNSGLVSPTISRMLLMNLNTWNTRSRPLRDVWRTSLTGTAAQFL